MKHGSSYLKYRGHNPMLNKELFLDFFPPLFSKLYRKYFLPTSWSNLRFQKNGTLELPGGHLFNFRPHESSDRKVCKQIFLKKDYELGKLSRYKELMKYYNQCSLPLIVDAGANIGASSVWFALHFPLARIISIEPEPGNFAMLSKNSCSFPGIIPFNNALASHSGILYLTDPKEGAWGYRTTHFAEEEAVPVQAKSIEDFLDLDIEQVQNPFILKIDIEGAESDLFSKFSPKFDEFPLIIIEVHDWLFPKNSCSKNFLKWHVEHNRDFVHFGENIFSISNRLAGNS
jgi:FkbM family methyltransferase|nr:MAG: SAM-dependent methyltransferase [Leptospirillum sp. Group II '5-way CG']